MANAVPGSFLCKHCCNNRNCVITHTSTQGLRVVSVFAEANMVSCPQPEGISLYLSLVSRVPWSCLLSSSGMPSLPSSRGLLMASPLLIYFFIPPLSPFLHPYMSPLLKSSFLFSEPSLIQSCVIGMSLMFFLPQLRHCESPTILQAYGCETI